jgi:glutathione synthase/RimK-type ligase-like ATP-grasp enzyme
MTIIVVVNNPNDWQLDVPGIQVVSARSYLTDPSFSELEKVKVFNLCRSYRYQANGYYVSLLAAARGHRPLPNVATIQDMKSQTIIRFVSDDLDELIQESLGHIKADEFVLSIYFGKNLAKRYDRLAQQLFSLFQAPFIRAYFENTGKKWQLTSMSPIAASELPEDHKPFVIEVTKAYFSGKKARPTRPFVPRFDMAILHNPKEVDSPSDAKALQKFIKAAESMGIGAELITKEDYSRLAEFDALFIRETTNVNHHTFRFARRAAAEGLVVMDDPDSILKCTNKVYLAELLHHHEIPHPTTLIVHKDNVEKVIPTLGLPVILKQPDSAFSQGVVKASTEAELMDLAAKMLDKSDLIIAQQYMPTEFDWRIGIIDRRPIFACKYYMARRHWQIIKRDAGGKRSFGGQETIPVELVPRAVMKHALAVANLIGDGLYGVDMKQVGDKAYVVEINDNPNIDSGVEDTLLKDNLYLTVMQVFLKRIEERKRERSVY